MDQYLKVLEAAVPVFSIAVVGLLLRRANWLTEQADQSLLRVAINVLFPCLILDSTLGNPAVSRINNLLLAPTVGFATVVVGLLIAGGAAGIAGLKSKRERGTFSVTVGIYNYSYVPLPLAWMLFGQETVGVLFVHNLGVEVAMWTIGVMMLGAGAGRGWRQLINPPLIAIAGAVAINAVGLDAFVPKVAHSTFHWLGQCAIPMSLILIGAVIADHLHEFQSRAGWRVIGTAVVLRVCILPMMFLVLAKYLPASMELKHVIVLEAAMPSAVFPIVMARVYGGDPATALRVVIGTSAVGLVTIPFWVQLGLRFIGP